MNNMIKKLKIGTKIYLGFSILVLMLVAITGTSFLSMQRIHHGFLEFEEMATDGALVSQLQGDLAYTAKDTLEWLRTRDPEVFKLVVKDEEKLISSIEEAKAAIQHPERAKNVQIIEEANEKFYQGLKDVASYYEQRDELVLNQMDVIGPEIRKKITDIGDSAFRDDDYETAARAGFANQELLLARLYAGRFLLSNKIEFKERYNEHKEAFMKTLNDLESSIQNKKRIRMLEEVKQAFPKYDQAFNDAYQVILKRNDVIKGELLETGSMIEEAVLAVNESVIKDIHRVDKEMDAMVVAARNQSVVLTILGFIFGVTISLVISRAILKPLGEMRGSLVKLSEGDVKEEIPYTENEDEIGDMARSLAEFREEAVTALRSKSGMQKASANIMMADEDLNIVFMNDSQEKMLRVAEADLKTVLPNFDVGSLMGQNIDLFHKNPAHQRQLLDNLQNSYSTRIEVAGRTFDLFANPAFSKAGQRIGTTIEWVDRTAELAVAAEIKDIISAASKGDLSSRISLDGKSDFFLEVSEGVNNLAAVMQNVANDLATNLKALSKGDLCARINSEYEGIFKQLKDDYNVTSERLADIVSNIKMISSEVSESSDNMADSSNGLAGRAEQQASTLEQTAASMEELTSTVKTNADNAKEANQAATETRSIAEKGSQVANDAGVAMEKINESSKEITDIINVIDEIAFQTNLLALNAAVEAARAGDAGRGFAVVAQEVRTLAQRSAQSSKDIKALIDNSSKQVSDGVELVQTAVTSLQKIHSAINSVADTVGQISTASAEQATSLDELNQAVMDMDSMTQQNASMAHQTRNIAQAMQGKSGELAEMVDFFKINEQEQQRKLTVKSVQANPSVVAETEPANQPKLNGADPDYAVKKAAVGGGSAQAVDNDADWKEF